MESSSPPSWSALSSWSCRHEVGGLCKKVDLAFCRPGMKGCVLVGKVTFPDGVIPAPVWPEGSRRAARASDPGPGGPGIDDGERNA